MATVSEIRVEEKLFQNRYLVDAGRAHIKVAAHAKPSPNLMALTKICPAGCYTLSEGGQVGLSRTAASSAAPVGSCARRAARSNGTIRAVDTACCSSSAEEPALASARSAVAAAVSARACAEPALGPSLGLKRPCCEHGDLFVAAVAVLSEHQP